jgi:hypothetical protein
MRRVKPVPGVNQGRAPRKKITGNNSSTEISKDWSSVKAKKKRPESLQDVSTFLYDT